MADNRPLEEAIAARLAARADTDALFDRDTIASVIAERLDRGIDVNVTLFGKVVTFTINQEQGDIIMWPFNKSSLRILLNQILKEIRDMADQLTDVKAVLDSIQTEVNTVGTDLAAYVAKVSNAVDPTSRQAILDEGNAIVAKLTSIDTSVNPPVTPPAGS